MSPDMGAVQDWLQHRRWPLWRIGNALSSVRYWIWKASR